MVGRELFFFSLGFGVCIFGMALVKKFFKRKKIKDNKFNDSVVSATLKELSKEGLLDSLDRIACSPDDKTSDLTKSASSSSANSDSSINKEVRQARRKLNSTLRKFRKGERKLQRKKNEVTQMQREIDSLLRSIKAVDSSMESLDAELNNQHQEITALISQITPEMEAETRKKEVICYKRYTNIQTVSDVQALLKMIKQRREALKNLEILTFKKYWSITHNTDKPADINNSFILRSGFDGWFRQFRRSTASAESSQDSPTTSPEDDLVPTRDTDDTIPASFIPLLESSL